MSSYFRELMKPWTVQKKISCVRWWWWWEEENNCSCGSNNWWTLVSLMELDRMNWRYLKAEEGCIDFAPNCELTSWDLAEPVTAGWFIWRSKCTRAAYWEDTWQVDRPVQRWAILSNYNISNWLTAGKFADHITALEKMTSMFLGESKTFLSEATQLCVFIIGCFVDQALILFYFVILSTPGTNYCLLHHASHNEGNLSWTVCHGLGQKNDSCSPRLSSSDCSFLPVSEMKSLF